jgi:hypothetical protein
MRIAVWLAAAGTLLLAAGCGSSSNGSSTGPTLSLTPNTTVAGAASTAAGATSGTPGSSTPAASPPSLPSDPAKAVQTFYAAGGGTLTDAEATCVAESTGPSIVGALQATIEGGDLSDDAGKALLKAFAACQPASYMTQTSAAIAQESGATQDQATCVLTAVDKLFATDDAVLSQAASQTSAENWPTAEHQKFHDAVRSCVPEDLTEKIVDA